MAGQRLCNYPIWIVGKRINGGAMGALSVAGLENDCYRGYVRICTGGRSITLESLCFACRSRFSASKTIVDGGKAGYLCAQSLYLLAKRAILLTLRTEILVFHIALGATGTPLSIADRLSDYGVVVVNQRRRNARLARHRGDSDLGFSGMCPATLDAGERELQIPLTGVRGFAFGRHARFISGAYPSCTSTSRQRCRSRKMRWRPPSPMSLQSSNPFRLS